MNVIFEVVDFNTRKIRLTKKQYLHIVKRHPSVADYFEEVKETIRNPDVITRSKVDEDVRYYYKYYKELKSPHKYILVVVKYLNGGGFIISVYFEKSIK